MLNWSKRFNIFCFLDTHGYDAPPRRWDWLLGAGAATAAGLDGEDLHTLDRFLAGRRWAFGHLAYELGHRFFPGLPLRPDPLDFPHYYFFEPRIVLAAQNGALTIEAPDPDAVWAAINATALPAGTAATPVPVHARLTREDYLAAIRSLQANIRRGDCYEINFCQEFFAHAAQIDPWAAWTRLSAASPAPFGGFYRLGHRYLLCASPERFLKREGDLLTAQPIKGTARRLPADPVGDAALAQELLQSSKERAENVMIVDLMRNDLSRICRAGSVRVPELFGLYSFPQVHQLISTIEGVLPADTTFPEVLEATFPMGSMTGAPKRRVLELIDRHEGRARGIFSGSIGYFHEGDFDLNVVIRSLMYNEASSYLSYQVGSGITVYSDPAAEWEECLLKAKGMERALGNGVMG
ncbi:anthranilate synthase component I family protein [Flaviaesturariibacter amylovorans]|uniref:Anthranilate synthase component I family protein n=1 Tax=Flaviaesturariibacter amylovorans TaxID=1084520 RepID=A0ABP8H9R8_9BACT